MQKEEEGTITRIDSELMDFPIISIKTDSGTYKATRAALTSDDISSQPITGSELKEGDRVQITRESQSDAYPVKTVTKLPSTEWAERLKKAHRFEDAAKIYEKLDMHEKAGEMREKAKKEESIRAEIKGENVQIGDKKEDYSTTSVEKTYDQRQFTDKSKEVKDSVVNRSEIGEKSEKTFEICPYCGEELELPKTPKFCPYCREKLK